MTIRSPRAEEIPQLAAMSKAAFDSDALLGAPEPGGPPEYDSEAWHEQMRAEGHLLVLEEDGAPVGGLILFQDGEHPERMYVGRLFIDPTRFREGLGTAAMLAAEQAYPEAREWRLDTPARNARTNAFYQKLGYRQLRAEEGFIYYRKLIR